MALLEVEDLRTHLFSRRGVNKAVDGVSFSLEAGRSLGVVGESGSGKSMTALSILRLLPHPYGKIVGGSIRFNGEKLLDKSEREMRDIRGKDIAIILQDPMTSLIRFSRSDIRLPKRCGFIKASLEKRNSIASSRACAACVCPRRNRASRIIPINTAAACASASSAPSPLPASRNC